MKLPIIRQFVENNTVEDLEKTAEVLEKFTEFRGVSDEDLNVVGEILTNIFGAIEVHENIKNGIPQKDALNNFAQKVLGSIDK